MTLEDFINESISPWMREDGPDSDIVLSSRIRLARNFADTIFPMLATEEQLEEIRTFIEEHYGDQTFQSYRNFAYVSMHELSSVEKRVLVERHLVSPHLVKRQKRGSGVLISENEQVSMMVNEEDHLRLQLYFPGFQLQEALKEAFAVDDWIESKVSYAFDESKGYLTACPTNVGTGMRASVMMHLPALAATKQINRMIPTINQLGLVVRGMYGEGSSSVGNVFQISNQITLGKSEHDIVEDLVSVVRQLVEHERQTRIQLMENSPVQVEDRVYRSYGVLENSRLIGSQEASTCISNVRLGIDLGIIKDVSKNILNELMVLTQPGCLQQYANSTLKPHERDQLRADLIRDRLQLEKQTGGNDT